MVYTVTVTQRNVFEIDDEDEELQNFRKAVAQLNSMLLNSIYGMKL